MNIDVYWHDRRIGHLSPLHNTMPYGTEIHAIRIATVMGIKEIASIPIVFDPDFAELYGITGVPLEPREEDSDA